MAQAEIELPHVVLEKHGPQPVNQGALGRLKKIEGQVRGLHRMVEEQKYCVEILTQIAAVRAALKSVGIVILRRHLEHCVAGAMESGGSTRAEIIDELMSIISKEQG